MCESISVAPMPEIVVPTAKTVSTPIEPLSSRFAEQEAEVRGRINKVAIQEQALKDREESMLHQQEQVSWQQSEVQSKVSALQQEQATLQQEQAQFHNEKSIWEQDLAKQRGEIDLQQQELCKERDMLHQSIYTPSTRCTFTKKRKVEWTSSTNVSNADRDAENKQYQDAAHQLQQPQPPNVREAIVRSLAGIDEHKDDPKSGSEDEDDDGSY